jgi:uncharacterized protein YdhG (YjbR/CyaY superfamily)
MNPEKKQFKNIDEYISDFSEEVRILLEEIRFTIKNAATEAEEIISYQMPAFKYHGILVYFAAFKNHIGFYPTSSGIEMFKSELSEFNTSKGAVQFPYNKPIPYEVISKIVKFRVKENKRKQNKN